jgi:hypothetical protein
MKIDDVLVTGKNIAVYRKQFVKVVEKIDNYRYKIQYLDYKINKDFIEANVREYERVYNINLGERLAPTDEISVSIRNIKLEDSDKFGYISLNGEIDNRKWQLENDENDNPLKNVNINDFFESVDFKINSLRYKLENNLIY